MTFASSDHDSDDESVCSPIRKEKKPHKDLVPEWWLGCSCSALQNIFVEITSPDYSKNETKSGDMADFENSDSFVKEMAELGSRINNIVVSGPNTGKSKIQNSH